MGFLKSLGVRKQAAALKPFMRSDEHFPSATCCRARR
jgi:hypothetical protein